VSARDDGGAPPLRATARQRRELGGLIALIAATVLAAAAVPVAGAVLAAAFAGLWAFSAHESRALLQEGLHAYHAPPFARACDCATALARHCVAFARRRSLRSLTDALLAFGFFGLIVGSITLLEVEKHAPHLAHSGVGLAVGIVGWHIALELTHEPDRLARYRRGPEPPVRRPWVFPALLLFELAVFLALEASGDLPHHPFVRGLLFGVAAIGLSDAAALGSTLLAIVLRGRPLR
jgi:hypothetical protein